MKHNILPVFFTLILISCAHFLVDFMIGAWAVYKTLAHLDLAIAGLISGLAAFAGEGMQVVFGPLCDKGYRKQLVIFGLIATCASALLSLTSNYFILLFLFTITCLGSGAFHPAAISLAGLLTVERKSLFISICSAGGALGLASSQLLFSSCYHFFGGNTLLLAIPSMLLMGLVAYFGLAAPQHHAQKEQKHDYSLKTLLGFFFDRELRLLYIAQVTSQSFIWGTLFLLPDVLVSRGHDPWICYGGGHLFFVIGGACMMIPSGYLSDKYSPRSVILSAIVGGISLFYLFLFVPDLPIYALLIVFFLFGATLQIINPMIVAFGNKLRPLAAGMVTAFLMGLAWCISEGLGQFGGGLLTKLFTDDAPAKALGVLSLLLFVSMAATINLPKLVPLSKMAPLKSE